MESCKYKIFIKFYNDIINIKDKFNNMDVDKYYQYTNKMYNKYINKTDDPVEYQLLNSLIYNYMYTKKIQDEEFMNYIKDINKSAYEDKARDILNNIKDMIDDPIQLNTIKRIIKIKPKKPILTSLKDIRDKFDQEKDQIIDKICPHCGVLTTSKKNTNYIICGYTQKGFDWKGCGFDWCFSCGKKLCKCWNINHLFNMRNRYHNNRCCINHALKTGSDYYEDYCQCESEFVKRNQN